MWWSGLKCIPIPRSWLTPSSLQSKHCWGPGRSSLDLRNQSLRRQWKKKWCFACQVNPFFAVQLHLDKLGILLVLFIWGPFLVICVCLLIQRYWNIAMQATSRMSTNPLCLCLWRIQAPLLELWPLCQDWQSQKTSLSLSPNCLVTFKLSFLPPEEVSLEFSLVVHHFHECILNK